MSGIGTGRGRRTPRPRRLALERLEDRRLLSVFSSPAELEEYLVQDALKRYEHLFGQPAWSWWPWLTDATASGGGPTAPVRQTDSLDHSETNVQTPGVDEADLVETDGDYLYVLSGHELLILDSWPAEEVHVASRLELAGRPLGEYLWGDRLAVISETGGWWDPVVSSPSAEMWRPVPPWPVPQPTVTVTVLDIADRTSPRVIQQTELAGSLVDSRALGSFVYLVMRHPFVLPGPEPLPAEPGVVVPKPPEGGGWSVDSSVASSVPEWIGFRFPPPDDPSYVYETVDQYLARISGHVLELTLPQFTSVDGSGTVLASGLLDLPPNLRRPRGPEETELTTVVVFDMASGEPGPVFSLGVPGRQVGPVFVSTSAIYLTESVWPPALSPLSLPVATEYTRVTKLEFQADGSVAWSAEGMVPGRVQNSFSMDENSSSVAQDTRSVAEHNRLLRVVATQGWGNAASSGVYVLQASEAGELTIVGQLEGLAPGEQLFAARFLGDKAYLVTFLRVDPLMVVDLSDPTRPHLAGELEIPGFSNYLHPVEGGYLIGIGRHADPATGQWGEPQISLFDVRDPQKPVLLDRYTIDVGPWGWSEAFSDHHAVSYFPDQRVLTLAVTSAGWWLPGADRCYLPPKTQLFVFRIDVPWADGQNPSDPNGGNSAAAAGRIELLGTIEHDQPIRRSVRIEDYLYAISQDTLSVHELLHPENEIKRLYFGNRLEDLGAVEWRETAGAGFEPSDPWYAFQAARDGLLTLEVASPAGADRVRLTLYDAQLRPLADSVPTGNAQRIDWSGQAGRRYYVRVSPFDSSAAPEENFTLRLANRVVSLGSSWTVFSGLGDRLEVRLDRGQFTLNGLTYALPPGVTELDLRALAQAGTAVVRGVAEGQTAIFKPREVTVQAGPLTVSLRDLAEITVEAAAGAKAEIFADPATPGRLSIFPSGAVWSDGQVKHTVRQATQLVVHGASDPVDLYGSLGDDLLEVRPGWLELSRTGYTARLENVPNVAVHANQGGFDTARLFGTSAADRYVGQPGLAVLTGPGYSVTLEGFESVIVDGAGGSDAAWLFDAPGDDHLTVEASAAALLAGTWSHRVEGFARVTAYAAAGGTDAASFRLAADAVLESYPDFVRVRGIAEYWAWGFATVQATGTPLGTGAWLFDSPGDDRLEVLGRTATLAYADRLVQVLDFAWVQAQSMRGGIDRKRQEAAEMALAWVGSWLDKTAL